MEKKQHNPTKNLLQKKIPSFIKSCILPELVKKWSTKLTEPSSDQGTDIATDILDDSEDSHSPDDVYCVTEDVEVFEEHACVTTSTCTNTENDDFINLASQVVGNSVTATDSTSPVDTDFDTADLQAETANTSIADATSNQQDPTESVPANSGLWCKINVKNQWLAVTTLLVE